MDRETCSGFGYQDLVPNIPQSMQVPHIAEHGKQHIAESASEAGEQGAQQGGHFVVQVERLSFNQIVMGSTPSANFG